MTNKDELVYLMNELRRQMDLASGADERVKRHRERINRHCTRNNYSEHQRREKFKIDYDFLDALDDYRLRCSEVQRYSALIQAIVAVRNVANLHSV